MKSELEITDLKKEIDRLNKEINRREKAYIEQKEELKKAKEYAEESKKKLHDLVETAVGDIGQDFFNNIIVKLSQWLNVECVVIGQMTEDEQRIDCLPLYLDGKISHNFSYRLADSPCDITTRKGYCCYANDVINIFPKDELLVDLEAEGYVGTALYNKEGKANGVICAVSRKKLNIPSQAEDILKIIGARVSAEIERKKIEESLKTSEQKLKESNNAKDRFFSILAHDLKSPLNSLIGLTKLLYERYDEYNSDKIKNIIKILNETSEVTNDLLDNLLNWAQTQQGTIDYHPETIKANEFIGILIRQYQKIAKNKKINMVYTMPDDLVFYADKNMLSTVIRNLLFNAIKFTNTGGEVKLDIKKNDNEVLFIVEDNGIGIKSDIISKLFKQEYMISTMGTRSEKGTGLGLILCKEFVIKHKGNIWVESETGVGTKFYFTIPEMNNKE